VFSEGRLPKARHKYFKCSAFGDALGFIEAHNIHG
jgi:hypothetical protein